MGKSIFFNLLLAITLVSVTSCTMEEEEDFEIVYDKEGQGPISDGDYYVAPWGNDNDPGTFDLPWATWQKAFETAEAGDVVYFRGGVYYPETTQQAPYMADVTTLRPQQNIGNCGTEDKPICFYNYPEENPILDCINITAPGNYLQGIHIVRASYLKFRGLTIRNVLQKRDYVDVAGFSSEGCHNMSYENITVHHIGGKGFFIGASWKRYPEMNNVDFDYTYVTNIDAYNCADVYPRNSGDLPGNSADGIKMYNTSANHGMYIFFEGCRSWNNSDDGYDIGGSAIISINNCWSFLNGYLEAGNGTGFKNGGSTNTNWGSDTITRIITNNISAKNKSGFFLLEYDGYKRMNSRYYNNLSYLEKGTSFYFSQQNSEYPTVLAVWKNNVSCDPGSHQFSNAYKEYTESHNTWKYRPNDYPGYYVIYDVSEQQDFVSLSINELDDARKEDGSLPDINFGHLKPESSLVGVGTYVGMSEKPDLGIDWNYLTK